MIVRNNATYIIGRALISPFGITIGRIIVFVHPKNSHLRRIDNPCRASKIEHATVVVMVNVPTDISSAVIFPSLARDPQSAISFRSAPLPFSVTILDHRNNQSLRRTDSDRECRNNLDRWFHHRWWSRKHWQRNLAQCANSGFNKRTTISPAWRRSVLLEIFLCVHCASDDHSRHISFVECRSNPQPYFWALFQTLRQFSARKRVILTFLLRVPAARAMRGNRCGFGTERSFQLPPPYGLVHIAFGREPSVYLFPENISRSWCLLSAVIFCAAGESFSAGAAAAATGAGAGEESLARVLADAAAADPQAENFPR